MHFRQQFSRIHRLFLTFIHTKIVYRKRPCNSLLGHLDAPTHGTCVSHKVLVKGWCFSTHGTPIKGEVYLHDKLLQTIYVDKPRPDVPTAYKQYDRLDFCGFSELIGLPETQRETSERLTVKLSDREGASMVLGPVEVIRKVIKDSKMKQSNHYDMEQALEKLVDFIDFQIPPQHLVDVLQQTINIASRDKVLEIGCGGARTGSRLAPHVDTWIGLETWLPHAVVAKEVLQSHSNTHLVIGNGYDLGCFKDNSLDIIYCSIVFMLLDEWQRFNYLQEFFRVLKTNGRLYVDGLNLQGKDGWKIFQTQADFSPDFRPYNMCRGSTAEEIQFLVEHVGFEVDKISGNSLLIWVTAHKPEKR